MEEWKRKLTAKVKKMENKSKVKDIIREHIDSLKEESLETLTEKEKEYIDNVKVENNSNDLFDDIDEEFVENNVNNDLGDGIQEEVTGEMNIDEEEITKAVNPDDELRLTVLGIVSDLAYPIDYPGGDIVTGKQIGRAHVLNSSHITRSRMPSSA